MSTVIINSFANNADGSSTTVFSDNAGQHTQTIFPPPVSISPTAVAASTGINQLDNNYSIWGHTIPLYVFGVGRIGGELISGPVNEGGLVSGGISFGISADLTSTRTLLEVAFDSEIVWQGSRVGDGTCLLYTSDAADE